MTLTAMPETVEVDERLRLELHGAERAADWADAINQSLDHLRPWMDWAHRPTNVHEQAVRLALGQERFRAGGDGTWAIVDAATGDILGGCGLHYRSLPTVLDIGYWLRPEAVGNGYVTATAAALTRVAFTACGAQTVRITCDETNVRSAAVPRRLGFRHTGTEAGSMVWELTRDEWTNA